jgi:hypothetical protein
LKRGLEKAIEIQWDYNHLMKRKGKLERVKSPRTKTAAAPRKKAAAVKKTAPDTSQLSPPQEIDLRIAELSDWRGAMLARLRKIILHADPQVTEEVKWRKPSNGMKGVPVWEHAGIICTGETYKSAVKLTFPKGASLQDPTGLFNASLEGNARRAIDFHEGDKIDEKALQALIRAAVALNAG